MALTQLSTGPEILVLAADFPSTTPDALFRYWAEPVLLQQWWPQHAELEPREGGVYHLSWPSMDWHLRGRYTSFEPDRRLAFTWRWDHDVPELGERTVEVVFESLFTGGTRLLLTHGRYLDMPADQEIRLVHHLAGWQHFLPRLQDVCETSR